MLKSIVDKVYMACYSKINGTGNYNRFLISVIVNTPNSMKGRYSMKSKFKRSMALLCAAVITVSTVIPVFAEGTHLDTSETNDYNVYTITFDQANDSRVTRTASGTTIAQARAFVQSLNLCDEYSYIEEAAMDELDSYENAAVELTSYSVYVPTDTHEEEYYGTINGRKFYSVVTTGSSFRVDEKKGLKKTASTADKWNKFAQGLLNVGLCFANWQVTVPYTLISTALSNAGENYSLQYNSYLVYTYNVDTESRSIYTYNNGTKVRVRSDQTGVADFFASVAPVGTGFSKPFYTFERWPDVGIATANYDDKSAILQQCIAYYNRGASVNFYLKDLQFSDKFE